MGARTGGHGDETLHEVTLTVAYEISDHETTQSEYADLMGGNPSNKNGCGASCPVEQVTWWAALAYANARSAQEGLPECFGLPSTCSGSAAGGNLTCTGMPEVRAPGGNVTRCTGYRLPTEAEWEHAYRAGTETPFYAGAMQHGDCAPLDPVLDRIGWYCGNANETTHPVKQKSPNAWGLYDMAGNVWEIVWDGYAPLTAAAATDPLGDPRSDMRIVRGGGWSYGAERCRASARVSWESGGSSWATGFRIARSVGL